MLPCLHPPLLSLVAMSNSERSRHRQIRTSNLRLRLRRLRPTRQTRRRKRELKPKRFVKHAVTCSPTSVSNVHRNLQRKDRLPPRRHQRLKRSLRQHLLRQRPALPYTQARSTNRRVARRKLPMHLNKQHLNRHQSPRSLQWIQELRSEILMQEMYVASRSIHLVRANWNCRVILIWPLAQLTVQMSSKTSTSIPSSTQTITLFPSTPDLLSEKSRQD